MSDPRRQDGFTMLEILIVVTIIGALMALLANNFWGQTQKANLSLAKTQIAQIGQALEFYRLDNGRYPTTEQGLAALIRAPVSDPAPRHYRPGGYMKADVLLDPWQNEIRYEAPGRHNSHAFDLASLGPDGLEGGDNENADIVNWDTGGLH